MYIIFEVLNTKNIKIQTLLSQYRKKIKKIFIYFNLILNGIIFRSQYIQVPVLSFRKASIIGIIKVLEL